MHMSSQSNRVILSCLKKRWSSLKASTRPEWAILGPGRSIVNWQASRYCWSVAPLHIKSFLSLWFMTVAVGDTHALALIMPVRAESCSSTAAARTSSASLIPPPPINTHQPGVATSLLYSGSQFRGHQKSKGNSYDVEVVLQVNSLAFKKLGMMDSMFTSWPCKVVLSLLLTLLTANHWHATDLAN